MEAHKALNAVHYHTRVATHHVYRAYLEICEANNQLDRMGLMRPETAAAFRDMAEVIAEALELSKDFDNTMHQAWLDVAANDGQLFPEHLGPQ